jgi:hypothetical protein
MLLPRIAPLVFAVSLSAFGATEPPLAPEQAFGQLKQLVGQWKGKTAEGRTIAVSYRLTAGDTVLMETWTLSTSRESLTLYHLDGEDLLATHYCPQGNQPRLRFISSKNGGRLAFGFRDGTNLQAGGGFHQHSFWIRFLPNGSFERSETYLKNGTPPSVISGADKDQPITFTRVP